MIRPIGVRPSARARERLRLALDSDNWTQRELAKRVGKSQPWLQKILTGENALRLDDLDRVAAALGIPPGELIRDGGNELVEIAPTELQAVRALRAMSVEVRLHCVAVLSAAAQSGQTSEKARQPARYRSGTKPEATDAPASVPPPLPEDYKVTLTHIAHVLANLASGERLGAALLGVVPKT